MKKRVFIIHGWSGYPEEGWFPWLKQELEARGFETQVPAMPSPMMPNIKTWVSFLNEIITNPDENTFLVGHSIGCQTILRYLEGMPQNTKVGGAVFVGGWMNLTDESYETENDKNIAEPWLETPIDWANIKIHTDRFVAIFSDSDPFVPLADSEIFKNKLGAEIIIEKKQGHFNDLSGTIELPSALNAILEMAKWS